MRIESGARGRHVAAARDLRRGVSAALLAAVAAASCGSDETPRTRAAQPIPRMFRGTLVGTRLPPLPVRAWLDGANPLHDGRPRRVEMIVFWSASETSAESALRLADSLAAAHGPERLRVVTVHTSVGPEDFEAPQARFDTIRARHPSLPTAIDDGSSALRRCRLSAVPSIVFVDADGTIRGALDNYRRGRIDDIAAFVEKLLSEPR